MTSLCLSFKTNTDAHRSAQQQGDSNSAVAAAVVVAELCSLDIRGEISCGLAVVDGDKACGGRTIKKRRFIISIVFNRFLSTSV